MPVVVTGTLLNSILNTARLVSGDVILKRATDHIVQRNLCGPIAQPNCIKIIEQAFGSPITAYNVEPIPRFKRRAISKELGP